MEESQEKDYSFLGNETFPNLYNALVYERKFKREYLERQIYERLLESEPSIVKLMESKSDLSRLSTLSDPPTQNLSRIKANTYQSYLYIILKDMLQGDLDVLVNHSLYLCNPVSHWAPVSSR